jgi:hypothetical protein
MKFIIKRLITISLITLAIVSSLSVEKKGLMSKKSMREGGGGTWELGYTCPKLRIWKSSESGDLTAVANVKIYPMQIADPENDIQRSGIIFTFEKSNSAYGHVQKIMIPTDPQEPRVTSYILPYRHIYSNFYTEKVGFWKFLGIGGGRHLVLMGKVRDFNDPKTIYKIKLTLPYKGNNLLDMNQTQLERIVFKINEHKENIRHEINDLKLTIISTHRRLGHESSIIKDLDTHKTNIDALRTKFGNRLEELNLKLLQPVIVKEMLKTPIKRLRKELMENNLQRAMLKSIITAFHHKKDEILKEIEILKGGISAEELATIKKNLDSSKAHLIATMDHIVKIKPENADYINKYTKPEFFDKHDVNDFIRRITKATVLSSDDN